jgi:hypothetical protein
LALLDQTKVMAQLLFQISHIDNIHDLNMARE